ncbi:FixH family protein [Sphingopyxis solisilvae]|uniref:FixH family protein n=1 Tax=Sphingopyxis solisilvae TaxID=1886788 RepID=UPI001892912D|nr:FixH family protein [Sphingopyxis solisilvae]
MSDKPIRKVFTGWHMTTILVGFFAVVITVNFTMARLAMSTFGGKVVENSYVASQHYNVWLARAEAQDRLGWIPKISLDGDRHVRVEVRKDGRSLTDLRVAATASHPLGRTAPATLRFEGVADGAWRSVEPLAVGRQRLDIVVGRGADEARYRMDMK